MNDVDGDIREAIAARLNLVSGLVGSVDRPSVLAQGAAWPQFDGFVRDGNNYLQRQWNVFVITPQQENAASKWIQANGLDVIEALKRVLFVDTANPRLIASSTSGQPAVFGAVFTGRE